MLNKLILLLILLSFSPNGFTALSSDAIIFTQPISSCFSFSKDSTNIVQTQQTTQNWMNEPLSNLDGGNMFNAVQKQKIIFGNTQSFKTKRLPRKTDAITFFALLKGQNSAQQLDITDKIKPNDIYASKYYPERKLYDDQGYILNLEARVKLLDFSTRKSNLMQLVFFVDTSAIAMNQYIFTDGLNHTTLSGAGVGINWSYEDNYDVKIYFSNKLDKQVLGITPDFSQLFWFQAVKYY